MNYAGVFSDGGSISMVDGGAGGISSGDILCVWVENAKIDVYSHFGIWIIFRSFYLAGFFGMGE